MFLLVDGLWGKGKIKDPLLWESEAYVSQVPFEDNTNTYYNANKLFASLDAWKAI